MDFDFTEEQRQLGDALQRFVSRDYPFEKRKAILQSPDGFSREAWKQLAELGFLALLVPEEQGGMGAGPVELLLAMNAIGKGLLLEPYLPSAVLATRLLQGSDLLPRMAQGDLIVVPAHGERASRYDLEGISTTADADGVLRGEKTAVLHAPAADFLVASARGPDGISLYLVPRAEARLTSYRTMDGQRAADVKLDGARGTLVVKDGLAALEAAFDVGLAALCAEAVGILQATLDTTIEYTRTRQQFGQPIGRFQALQHRMAEMFIHVEEARSMSYLAAMRCMDSDASERRRAVSAAKALVGQACRFVGQQAIQLHGGMGMTDELMVSHYFRRLTAIELSLGDTEHHLEKFAFGNV